MGLRVGIDGRYLQDHFPGIGRYTYELIKSLGELEASETFVVFYNPRLPNSRFDLGRLARPRVRLWPTGAGLNSPWGQLVMALLIRRARLQVFHSPHYLLPFLAPCPLVATIHDTIPLQDSGFLPSPWGRLMYNIALRLALLRSRYLIADSSAAREDLMRRMGVSPERVRVVYPGVEAVVQQVGQPPPGKTPYLLYVGTNKPHKNLVRLVQAYAQAKLEHHLIIAGNEDPRFPQVRREVERLGLEGRVRFLGQVGEAELKRLYQEASLFVFPSLAEGFGLPVLEAMAAGLPVVSSRAPALPEVVGEAALLVDPLDVGQMAEAIRRAATDPALAQDLACRGRERATLFSWEETARGCLRIYRELGGAG
jgi:alpha-1,3-rhamnosyl/mannosyltransferase